MPRIAGKATNSGKVLGYGLGLIAKQEHGFCAKVRSLDLIPVFEGDIHEDKVYLAVNHLREMGVFYKVAPGEDVVNPLAVEVFKRLAAKKGNVAGALAGLTDVRVERNRCIYLPGATRAITTDLVEEVVPNQDHGAFVKLASLKGYVPQTQLTAEDIKLIERYWAIGIGPLRIADDGVRAELARHVHNALSAWIRPAALTESIMNKMREITAREEGLAVRLDDDMHRQIQNAMPRLFNRLVESGELRKHEGNFPHYMRADVEAQEPPSEMATTTREKVGYTRRWGGRKKAAAPPKENVRGQKKAAAPRLDTIEQFMDYAIMQNRHVIDSILGDGDLSVSEKLEKIADNLGIFDEMQRRYNEWCTDEFDPSDSDAVLGRLTKRLKRKGITVG